MKRFRYCDGLTRRNMLQLGIMGGTGLGLSPFLRASEKSERKATADAVLFINLAGGPAHLDTLDMKPEAPAETKGEFKPIPSKIPGLHVCEHLPNLAQVIDQFTLLRGIGHTVGDHPQGQSYLSTGNRPTPAVIYPSLGSIVSKEKSTKPDLPKYIAIPKSEWNAGYMGDAYAPFHTNAVPAPGKPFQVRGISLAEGMTIDEVNRREKLLKRMNTRFQTLEEQSQLLEALDKFGAQAHRMITSPRAQRAFAVDQEPESIRKLFTPDEFSQSMLLGCRLIEFGVPFVTVTNAGWDTHLDNFVGHKRLMGPLDSGVPAAIATLREKGLLDRTLVVVMGEFGRTPRINENAGRDHYPRVNWALLAGGGVKPGQFIGGTNKTGTAPDDGTDITPDDLAATWLNALGIDPLSEYHTNTGRPVMLVPHGRVMDSIFTG